MIPGVSHSAASISGMQQETYSKLQFSLSFG
jgi:hypothetical protein